MRYEILGLLRVVDDKGVYTLGARKMETLLAVLLIRSSRVVSIEQLIAELWPEKPPRRATAALHVYISQLRKFLGRATSGNSAIVTRSPGYFLDVGADETDLGDFLRLVDQGRAHARAQRHEDAVCALQRALGLWRGSLSPDLCDGPIMRGFAAWLEELRLECVEVMAGSSLAIGRHQELTPLLYQMVDEHPLNETFYEQLMTALDRSGRRAEALRVYHSVRTTLREELGLEPSRALEDRLQDILVLRT
ncbi:AfsR/SARP family transcriptional regulator [Actinosynnema sp. NPDC020468]|uniref:AfsR/SARP family transcriptional regulator n=1 Tax=Actinosynnema sp. NPDC020468 TaxID=3154488 RepID=UPI0033C30303